MKAVALHQVDSLFNEQVPRAEGRFSQMLYFGRRFHERPSGGTRPRRSHGREPDQSTICKVDDASLCQVRTGSRMAGWAFFVRVTVGMGQQS